MAIMDESEKAFNRPFTTHSSGTKDMSDALSTVTPDVTSELADKSLSQYTIYFVIVPLIAILVVAFISFLVHLLVRRYRWHSSRDMVPVFHYDPADDSGWESELLDDTDPPFVRDNQRPIVRGTLNIDSNGTTSQSALKV